MGLSGYRTTRVASHRDRVLDKLVDPDIEGASEATSRNSGPGSRQSPR